MYFNTSAYVAIIWLSFDKKKKKKKKNTVLSKSQTELRSMATPQNEVYTSMEEFRQFLSIAVIFYGYILGKMLYVSIIMTTAGIK